MGLTGRKRNREQGLSRADAEHSRDAVSFPGSTRRPPAAGGAIRQSPTAGSSQHQQQHDTYGSASHAHKRAGKAARGGPRAGAAARKQKHVPLQKAGASRGGGQAAPVLSTAKPTLDTLASADCALPLRKRRNKNKPDPDPEPVVALAAPQHGEACLPSGSTLPVAAHQNSAGIGRPPQMPKATDMSRKRMRKKAKQEENAVPAPAQPFNKVPEQQTLRQGSAGQSAAKGKHHGQSAVAAKKALDRSSQGQPAAPAQQKAPRGDVNPDRQGKEQSAHREQPDARRNGSLEQKHQTKRRHLDGHAPGPKAHGTALAPQQATPRKAGNRKVPGATAAAKVAVQTVTALPLPGASVSANWAALKAQIAPSGSKMRPRKAAEPQDTAKAPEAIAGTQGVTPVLAVDCEMVGAGPEGARSLLARVCVVNQAGNVLLDEYVAQKERVTDYRTRFSGIRPSNLVGAPSLEEVQAKVAAMFKGRIVVGHSITNDLTALLLSHPRKFIRDTARFPPLMRATAPGRRPKPRALRHLAAQHLGLTIQAGEHSPVDDARAALYLYLRFQKEWEHNMERRTISQLLPPLPGQNGKAKRQRTLEEMAATDVMVDL